MKKNIFLILAVVSILSLALIACAPADVVEASTSTRRGPFGDPVVVPDTGAGTYGMGGGTGSGLGGSAMGTGNNLEPLSAEEIDGLIRAIEEEYHAQAVYESVMADFGSVSPFAEIAISEANQANALIRQAEKYGVEIPAFSNLDTSFASIEEACQVGVDAEIADAALYDELMAFTTHTDILRVYSNLQSASLNSHLPEFEACN